MGCETGMVLTYDTIHTLIKILPLCVIVRAVHY